MRVLTKEERKEKFETKWPEWELVDYTDYNGPCKLRHKCGNEKEYTIYYNVEKRGATCQVCNAKERDWYYDIGDQIDDLVILNRRVDELQEYQYKCLKCGFDGSKPSYFKGKYIDEYWIKGRGLKTGNRCACCRGIVVQPGINDVATTDPDIVPYFADIEDAIRYSRGSDCKIQLKCPICGRRYDKLVSVSSLVNEGRTCLYCGNTISYPERLMYFLLKEIDVDFEMHKIFDWSKNVYSEMDNKYHDREYDFYIPSINTIIEMHGSQHYRTTFSFNNKITHEEQQKIDEDKQFLAKQHCDYYIVIDCKVSNKNYIKNNIVQSELNNLLELSSIDWNKISRKALNGIARLVVADKEQHPEKTTTELADEYDVHYSTIITWLKKAGIYDPIDSKQIAGKQRSYPVYSPELNKAFRSMKLAANEIGVSVRNINSVLLPTNIQKSAGQHPITGERLTWQKWTLEQYEEWCKINNQSAQYLVNPTLDNTKLM